MGCTRPAPLIASLLPRASKTIHRTTKKTAQSELLKYEGKRYRVGCIQRIDIRKARRCFETTSSIEEVRRTLCT